MNEKQDQLSKVMRAIYKLKNGYRLYTLSLSDKSILLNPIFYENSQEITYPASRDPLEGGGKDLCLQRWEADRSRFGKTTADKTLRDAGSFTVLDQ